MSARMPAPAVPIRWARPPAVNNAAERSTRLLEAVAVAAAVEVEAEPAKARLLASREGEPSDMLPLPPPPRHPARGGPSDRGRDNSERAPGRQFNLGSSAVERSRFANRPDRFAARSGIGTQISSLRFHAASGWRCAQIAWSRIMRAACQAAAGRAKERMHSAMRKRRSSDDNNSGNSATSCPSTELGP